MEGIHIDITMITAIWMGGVILLVPLLGFTFRFGFAPFMDALARFRMAGNDSRSVTELHERFARLEEQVAELAGAVSQLSDAEQNEAVPFA